MALDSLVEGTSVLMALGGTYCIGITARNLADRIFEQYHISNLLTQVARVAAIALPAAYYFSGNQPSAEMIGAYVGGLAAAIE